MGKTELKVAVKFCGHCNPQMDMFELYRALLGKCEKTEFCFFSQDSCADLLLVLNACSSQCAACPPFSGQTVIVSPEEIDHWPVSSEHLLSAIQKTIEGKERILQ